MVLYLIGLGLGDEKDITLRGLDVVRGCSRVWLENYTSILGVDTVALVRFSRHLPLATSAFCAFVTTDT
jgi:diphthine synthase